MSLTYATRKQQWAALGLSLSIGLLLCVGFVATSRTLYATLAGLLPFESLAQYGELLSFPLLACFFHFSIPSPKTAPLTPTDRLQLWQMSVLPVGLALVYGWLEPTPGVSFFDGSQTKILIWYLICVPVGEEALFRGWFYNLCERLWPKCMGSPTNPLPLSLWASSLAFSLWHLQNLETGVGFTIFQVFYTFVTGLWLGYLRYKTGKIHFSILAHVAINGVASIL